jgi:hypothetical protein
VAKARWKEKHDELIILEHKFLVNGFSISRPAELDCFECEKDEKFPMKLSSGISISSVGENIHFHGFDWFLPTMDDQPNPLSGFLAKDLFAAARTDLRRNIFHQDWFSINLEYFTYKFCAGL